MKKFTENLMKLKIINNIIYFLFQYKYSTISFDLFYKRFVCNVFLNADKYISISFRTDNK